DETDHTVLGMLCHPHPRQVQPGQVVLEPGAGVPPVSRVVVELPLRLDELGPQPAAGVVVGRTVRTDRHGHADMHTVSGAGTEPDRPQPATGASGCGPDARIRDGVRPRSPARALAWRRGPRVPA